MRGSILILLLLGCCNYSYSQDGVGDLKPIAETQIQGIVYNGIYHLSFGEGRYVCLDTVVKPDLHRYPCFGGKYYVDGIPMMYIGEHIDQIAPISGGIDAKYGSGVLEMSCIAQTLTSNYTFNNRARVLR